MNHQIHHKTPFVCFLVLFALACNTGCFVEKSFPMNPGETILVKCDEDPKPLETRQWLVRAQQQLKHTLPVFHRRALLTEDMTTADRHAIDVGKYFGRNQKLQQTLLFNFWGLMHSAQSGGRPFNPKEEPHRWPNFEDVRIPITDDYFLCGKLGLAKENGAIKKTDCIVLLNGILGHNNTKRIEDIAEALLVSGYHVLSCEIRGHGQTDAAQPDLPFTMGVLETHDLLVVNDWLEDKPYVRRTGLIGFCWGANIALLTVWQTNLPPNEQDVSPRIAAHFSPLPHRRRFEAGVVAISPALRFEKTLEELDTPRWFVVNPALATVQKRIRRWLDAKGCKKPVGNIRQLIEFEYARSKELNFPGAFEEGLRYLRLTPTKERLGNNKLESAQVPVLIMHASNDPLAPAQDVADVISDVRNPAVAAIVLDNGGHVGFAPFAKSYYYSLISSFFDPKYGPAALEDTTVTASADRPVEKREHAQ